MKTLNKVFLVGSVGKDPEMKATGGGTTVANLSLATSHSHKDAQGNWQSETDWHNLVAYGRTAEVIRDYVKKGSPLHIEGRLQTRSWDDKATGKKMYRTEIVIDGLIMLGGNKDGGQNGEQTGGRQSRQSQSRTPAWDDNQPIADDDIPF